jgi:hypothetical protein
MKKIIMLMLAAVVAAIGSLFGQDLDEVLEQYYEVTGAEKAAKLESVIAKGKILQMGMEMEFTNIMKRPGKLYLEVPIQGQLMKQGYNGEVGWLVAPWSGSLDPVEISSEQLKSMKRQADIDGMLYNYEKKGYTTTLEGKEDMEGSPAYVIKQVDENGDVFIHYIDAENYVMLKTEAKVQVQGSVIEAESVYGNYKPIDGMVMAYSIESKVNGQTQSQIVMEEYVFDEPVNDSIFEMPPPAPKPEVEEEEK